MEEYIKLGEELGNNLISIGFASRTFAQDLNNLYNNKDRDFISLLTDLYNMSATKIPELILDIALDYIDEYIEEEKWIGFLKGIHSSVA